MRVRTVHPFLDLVEGVDRALNDEFDVTPERFAAINERGFGELVVAIEEEKPVEAVEPVEPVEEKPKKKAAPKKAKAKEE